jgi:hypothetical protein
VNLDQKIMEKLFELGLQASLLAAEVAHWERIGERVSDLASVGRAMLIVQGELAGLAHALGVPS